MKIMSFFVHHVRFFQKVAIKIQKITRKLNYNKKKNTEKTLKNNIYQIFLLFCYDCKNLHKVKNY